MGEKIDLSNADSNPLVESLKLGIFSIKSSPSRSLNLENLLPYYKMSWDNQPLKDYVKSQNIENNAGNKEAKTNISFANKVSKEEISANNFEL